MSSVEEVKEFIIRIRGWNLLWDNFDKKWI